MSRLPFLRVPPLLLLAMLAACSSVPPVPVVDRQSVSQSRTDAASGIYLVKKGDTLYSIALDNGLYYRDVQSWNSLDDPNRILVGQTLRLTPPEGASSNVKVAAVTPPANVQSRPVVEERPLGPAPAAQQTAKPVAKPAEPPASSAQAAAAEGLPNWAWPSSGKVVGTFGDGAGGKGIDIVGNAGDPVTAAGEGKVVYVGTGLRGYGQMVIVKHENNFLTAYAHNRKLLVTEGQNVRQGQKIAEMGDTDTDRVKLHFEVRKQGKPVDPLLYLPKK